ncbi:UBIQUITIN-CONJUGAT-2 domain-containing protein [Mycena sanguinolenta]|uniref:UBIQUITIN-CONJUGAT-2 domain-containing protein n=1 Tax=Mycena sanguinolenta TaxID=230812 RepID=A0A8H7CQG0_9AGAR|nr:UBIQUITIN-CONJUGAT-2 domain-containing protein [Mycena sanguinolenta]
MAPLLSRLYQDLAELHDSPYPGVAVFIDDANVCEFCLVLTPPSGPWKNLSLHFDVVLPDEWPILPPKISSSVADGIDHPNLLGSYVCCDLLKTRSEIYRGHTGSYTGGYSSAFTLRGLFLQFLTFFSSTKIDQDSSGLPLEIGDSVVVSYVRESDLHRRKKKEKGKSADKVQEKLRREWEGDTNEVIVLREQATDIGPLFETTKSSTPGPNRLHRIEERNYRWTSTFKAIRYWQCQKCPYGTDALPHCVKVVAQAPADADEQLTPPVVCHLGILDDVVLYKLAFHLPSESLTTFCAAYPRLHAIVQSRHILLERELSCFFLRTPLSDPATVLGIGVALNPRARTLSSDFEWLSERAFVEFRVRESIAKRPFGFFLPLAFSQSHFTRAHSRIWERLEVLDKEVQKAEDLMSRSSRQRAETPQRHEIITVVYRMMNNIVVSLMSSCDDSLGGGGPSNVGGTSSSRTPLLYASEKAVVAYCHLFHLVISLCRTDPHILTDATARLARFIAHRDTRAKSAVPDLGELIVLIIVVVCCPLSPPPESSNGGNAQLTQITWDSLAGPFLEEVLVRNVRWALRDAPHLEFMESGPNAYRLAETFAQGKTSFRLVMFQITFLNLFRSAYGGDLARLDANYGFPERGLPERMVEEVKKIYQIDTWPAFFERVKLPGSAGFDEETVSEMLREAVKTSAARKYHEPASAHRLNLLQGER